MVRIYRARSIKSTASVPVFPIPELAPRAPTSSDTNYAQGQLWVHETANPVVIYVYHGLGSWVPISGAVNAADQFTTDNGVGVPQLGNLNIVGGTNVQTTAVGDTITIDFAGAAGGASTFNTNSTPAVQVAGAISILGGTGLTTSGAGSAVTIELDVPVTVPHGGTGQSLLTDGGIVLGAGNNPVTVTDQPTDGQLLIGVSGADPVLGNLTSTGGSITITPGPGTLNLESVAGAFPWLLAPGPAQVLAVNTGYIGIATTLPVPANITYTLPVASAIGDIIEITNIGGDLPIIAQNALQSIRFTASQTSVGVGGSLTAVDQFSSIRLLCVVANTDWIVLSHTGNWVVV